MLHRFEVFLWIFLVLIHVLTFCQSVIMIYKINIFIYLIREAHAIICVQNQNYSSIVFTFSLCIRGNNEQDDELERILGSVKGLRNYHGQF